MRWASETSRNSVPPASKVQEERLGDCFETLLIAPAQGLGGCSARRSSVSDLDSPRPQPLRGDYRYRPFRINTSDLGVGLKIFEVH